DKELVDGTFDPKRYMSNEVSDQLRFFYFMENKYLPAQKRKVKRGDLSPSMYKKKLNYFKHLRPFYKLDLRVVGSGRVLEFYDSWTEKLRTRDLVIQELKTVLSYARDLELIESLPSFPKLKPSKKREANRFLSLKEQELIISKLENETYKRMISLLCLYALRPSEVRALKWIDFDFKNKVISISRHFSNGTELIEGRKSNKETHFLPMTDEFFKIMKDVPISIVKDNFVFLGKNGGAVADRVLARAWHKAREVAGIHYVQLYEGTKHSRLSLLKAKGHSDEELILLSGHTNIKTVQRYAQLNDSQKLGQVRTLLE
ncbi:MAG: tyrosine-type recombinase/integrase, partial [Halobacteriovoraceae bacterium]|nr:tyrosine-type recombinase/integrase [Halobacteriovoraceae bacterium]